MAVHTAGTHEDRRGWRPRPLALVLFALADFVGAVGLGNLFLGQAAKAWLLGAAALLLAGISASD